MMIWCMNGYVFVCMVSWKEKVERCNGFFSVTSAREEGGGGGGGEGD